MAFVPAAPGFKIQWIDDNDVIQEQADLIGWMLTDEGEILPMLWSSDGALIARVWPNTGIAYIDVVAK